MTRPRPRNQNNTNHPPLPTTHPIPTRDTTKRPLQTPLHRKAARFILAKPKTAFGGVVGTIILLTLVGLFLVGKVEKVRTLGGRKVVARDYGPAGKLGAKGLPPTVLILTPMKNSIEHIWHYFHLIDTLSYPRQSIQIGVLVSDSEDRTYARALELADERQYYRGRTKEERYGRISVFNKDFAEGGGKLDENLLAKRQGGGSEAGQGEKNVGKGRHAFALQVTRRKLLAKSRTWLLQTAITPEVDWVLWIDVDVVEYQKDLINVLLQKANETGADVVVPNCMWRTYNEMGSYDRNNWAETLASLEMKANLQPEEVLIEGYDSELKTHRLNMADYYPVLPTTPETMELDGVGGCATLVKADVHREGAVFPAWPVDHQLETEGFAQIAKRLGKKLIGLPKYYVYHGLYG